MCDHLAHLTQMQQLLADLNAQHRREQQAFAEGFKIGFHDGEEIGYGRRCAEEAQMWADLAEHVKNHARMRTWVEILKNRGEAA
ncbi:hypothetical protein [Streptosporangium sp. NPDC051022]|uniref:hypothetical protein n=1 Tax=Streptosporangium sp. NPDC051022 TaxID=3155752 RepID=UPI003414E25C